MVNSEFGRKWSRHNVRYHHNIWRNIARKVLYCNVMFRIHLLSQYVCSVMDCKHVTLTVQGVVAILVWRNSVLTILLLEVTSSPALNEKEFLFQQTSCNILPTYCIYLVILTTSASLHQADIFSVSSYLF
jgi:hypothetical protein